ncbi:hypothetical protein SDC9_56769 [bioreactor metagenome]|uniref:Uncharacterized protein n=1 Tax=bioreactor metagenome TaxID=1076179 RepID=A0A644X396_9ZZZZ
MVTGLSLPTLLSLQLAVAAIVTSSEPITPANKPGEVTATDGERSYTLVAAMVVPEMARAFFSITPATALSTGLM